MAHPRQIIHVDMDAFFASVEVLDDPSLAGKPVVVGGDPASRGVVAAASYPARKYGIRSALPMVRAVQMYPDLIILPVRMARYSEVSRMVFAVFERFTPLIEPISIDEAFLDVTGSIGIWKDAQEIGHTIKNAIKDEIGLVASVGIAPNKFLAKLASDLEKPDGFCVITNTNKQSILDPLPVSRIWGIGKVTAEKLKDHGITRIEHLRKSHPDHLKTILGNSSDSLLRLSQGIDDRPVEPPAKPKSISHEQTFAKDISNVDELLTVLLDQVENVATRLRASQMLTRTVTLKLRYGSFQTITRNKTLEEPTEVTTVLWDAAQQLFRLWQKTSLRPVRLLGFGASQLVDRKMSQSGLFTDKSEEKQKKIDRVTDRIKQRYGKDMIGRKY